MYLLLVVPPWFLLRYPLEDTFNSILKPEASFKSIFESFQCTAGRGAQRQGWEAMGRLVLASGRARRPWAHVRQIEQGMGMGMGTSPSTSRGAMASRCGRSPERIPWICS